MKSKKTELLQTQKNFDQIKIPRWCLKKYFLTLGGTIKILFLSWVKF
jgi:hypothetical protein